MMKFHSSHGKAIKLSADCTQAFRERKTFKDGLLFSEQPLHINHRIALRLGVTHAWLDALRVGVTTVNPASFTGTNTSSQELPSQTLPDVVDREGFWVRVLPVSLIGHTGCHIVLNLTSLGQLQLFVDGLYKGVLLLGLPTYRRLWLMIDLYGNTDSARLISTNHVPREIVTRGVEAVEAYESACASGGTQPVRRTRFMLVGPEQSGKTSLRRALMGQKHNPNEEKTEGIDTSLSCLLHPERKNLSWKVLQKGRDSVRGGRREDCISPIGIIGGDRIEEEQAEALANHMTLEVLLRVREDSQLTMVVRDTQVPKDSDATIELSATNKDILVVSDSNTSPSSSHVIHENISPSIAAKIQQILEGKKLEEKTVGKSLPDQNLQKNGGSERQLSEPTENDGDNAVRKDVEQTQGKLTDSIGEEKDETDQSVVLNTWDFGGQVSSYTTHQAFLTSRAVYCIVFNLCDDLSPSTESQDKSNQTSMKTLQCLDFWMRSIYSHATESIQDGGDNASLCPPMLIVGTHRDSLGPDVNSVSSLVQEKFSQLQEFLVGKPYAQLVVFPFFAVENSLNPEEDSEITRLREELEKVCSRQSYIGEHIPVSWLRFEEDVAQQAEQGTNFATYQQVSELAANQGITKDEEVRALLHLHHDLGSLVYFGNTSTSSNSSQTIQPEHSLHSTIILNPQWLINMLGLVTSNFPPKDKWGVLADKWSLLINHGILDESLLPCVWPDLLAGHRSFLMTIMAKFDLLCSRLPPAGQSHKHPGQSWYVPMRFAPVKEKKKAYVQTPYDAVFYVDFSSFLPEGLFHRLQVRTILWSQERGGRDFYLAQGLLRVFVDSDHDLGLEMCPSHLHRVKVLVIHVKEKEATSSKRNTPPAPETVAKVRNFLENSLCELRNLWMKRLGYKLCFPCPCKKICDCHHTETCSDLECMHFLDLDECLASQVVCCEHRRVNTDCFQKWFPSLHSKELKEPILSSARIEQSLGNIERHMPNLPGWLKVAAKLLNGAPDNQDWRALAKVMGYNQNRIDTMSEDLNPSLALLTDWIVSSGNTTMSVDVLLHYLKQLGCEDVADVILQAKEHELDRPQVFLSYQWDVQDQVAAIRDHLERAGYSCWMDIGQMGGGDQLASKIDQGLRACKIVIACVTPKYTASHLCNRELWLADMLNKPILPVVIETVGWPPPGAMAVILSQLVHINMKGVGGHGGTGKHADLQAKFAEIVQRVSLHASPDIAPCVDPTIVPPPPSRGTISSSGPVTRRLSDRFSGYRTSMSSLSEVDFESRPRQQVESYLPHSQRELSMDVMLSRYEDIAAMDVSGREDRAEQGNSADTSREERRMSVLNMQPVPRANVKQCAICNIL